MSCMCRQGAFIRRLEHLQTVFSMMRDPEDEDEMVAFADVAYEIHNLENQIELEECYCEDN